MARNVKLLLVLTLFVYVCLVVWLAGISSDSYRMVRAFDSDESGVLIVLKRMYLEKLFEPLSYNYGTSHTYISLFIINLCGFFSEISFKNIAFIARMVNCFSLCAVVVLFSRYGSIKNSGKWIFIYALVVLFVGLNFQYSVNAKPEHLQCMFVVCSLFLLQRYVLSNSGYVVFASGFFAGAAFSTKYVGTLLVMYEIGALFLVYIIKKELFAKFKQFASANILMLFGFISGIFFFGPYLVINYHKTISMLKDLSEWTRSGFLFVSDESQLNWLQIIFKENVYWYGFLIISIVSIVVISKKNNSYYEQYLKDNFVCTGWCLFYTIYVMLFAKVMAERYLIVVLPFAFDMTFFLFSCCERRLLENKNKFSAKAFSITIMIVAVFVVYTGMFNVISGLVSREKSPRIMAGKWLLDNVDVSKKIVFDLYTYVPESFQNTIHENYLDGYTVASARPDYIVTSTEIMSRYTDINRAEKYTSGKDEFLRRYHLYSYLAKDTLPGYRMIEDFKEVKIYKRIFN